MIMEELLYQNLEGQYLCDRLQPLLKNGGDVVEHSGTRYINVKESRNNKPLPDLYEYKELCCGCSACFAICPMSSIESNILVKYKFLKSSIREESFKYTGAITMLPDEEGFLYPVVDAEKCIRCYKCLSVCPYKE